MILRVLAALFARISDSLTLALGLLAAWLSVEGQALPSRWDPFQPLALSDPATPVQRWKIARALGDFDACQAALAGAGAKLVARDDMRESDHCAKTETVGMTRLASIAMKPVDTKCALALSMALWEARDLQPAADAHFGEPVAEILHFGSYNCRKIAGSSWWSQHATANAIDVSGFRLKSGREISVRRDWAGDDPAAAAFLSAAHAGACAVFRAALGPEYNAAHHDHFHLDLGFWRSCR